MLYERLSIKEAKSLLKYKDSRSVKVWCKNNGVAVLCDQGSNRQYILKREFEAIQMKQAIRHVKGKYGQNKIPEIFNSAMSLFSEYQHVKVTKSKGYKPEGEYEKSYLSMLQNIIHKI
mgnify:FL=1